MPTYSVFRFFVIFTGGTTYSVHVLAQEPNAQKRAVATLTEYLDGLGQGTYTWSLSVEKGPGVVAPASPDQTAVD